MDNSKVEKRVLRTVVPSSKLQLPNCPIPRPEDQVVWYSDARKVVGKLVGHNPKGNPVTVSDFGNPTFLRSYANIRLLDFRNRRGPNWMYLDSNARIVEPFGVEKTEFDRILSQQTPPGPRYIELITEIWSRGFEVFLVGGTVRDVLAGVRTNDVDLVTSMPLNLAKPLMTAMYRRTPSISWENGFVRLGGELGTTDPFIDMKMFSHSEPGTQNAQFGSRFDYDIHHRDFACNAVYYDPINNVLIDPTGLGIENAELHSLSLVCEIAKRAPFHLAQITIRFFKFLQRGFVASPSTISQIHADFVPNLAAMATSVRIKYLQTQLLSKHPRAEHQFLLSEFKGQMILHGGEQAWTLYFEPHEEEILNLQRRS